MKAKVILVVMAVVLGVGVVAVAGPEKLVIEDKVQLKLNLKAGEKYDMKMSQVQNVTRSMLGQEVKATQDMEMVMGYEVLGVEPNGVSEVKMTYKSMKVKVKSPQGDFEYDSAKPAADTNESMAKMMGAMYSAMFGGSMTIKMRPNGEVYDVNGLEAIMKKIGEGDGPEGAMMKKMFEQMFDEDKMKDSMGEMFVIFPDEAVGVGQAWYDELGLDIGFPIDVSTTYMLMKREGGRAYIDASAKMDLGDEAKKIDMGPMKMSFQVAGTISQSIVVDEASGWVLSSDGTMNLSGVIKLDASEQMPNGMAIPMKIDGVIKIETLKAE